MATDITTDISTADSQQFNDLLQLAKLNAKRLASCTTQEKNAALESIAATLLANKTRISKANEQDLVRGETEGLTKGLLDRLLLNEPRVEALASAVLEVVNLEDPVGQVVRGSTLANGIKISQVRVPFGVVGAIYEARPNVTVDIVALALKSGNGAVLRGGSAAESTNEVLVDVMQQAVNETGLPGAAFQTIDAFGRKGAEKLMKARGFVDVLIPRGSAHLISTVVNNSTVPVIETGAGVVHVYVDESADKQMALDIVKNAKTHRPSVCNAAETLLVHKSAAEAMLKELVETLEGEGVRVRLGHGLEQFVTDVKIEEEPDWGAEYLDLEMGIKVVSDIEEALEHIDRYSTGHTESIVTNDFARAEKFLQRVDSAVVMVNASTRFTDGGEFGFGAEVGISTQKLHARGPMGLRELTSTKWLVRGSGQIRS